MGKNLLTDLVYKMFQGENTERMALLFYFKNDSRAAYDVLIGSLDKEGLTDFLDIILLDGDEVNRRRLVGETVALTEKLLQSYEKVVFSISLFTTELSKYLELIRLLTALKKKYKGRLVLVAGGPHPSGDPVGCLMLGFDIVFVGEAEENFVDLIKMFLENKEVVDFRNKVKSVAFVDYESEQLVYTGGSKHVNLDKYPPFAPRRGLFNSIEITRGCPFGCRFCQVTYLFGARVRHRSIDNILFWVEYLLKNNKRDIRFISPNALCYGSRDGLKPNYDLVMELLTEVFKLVRRYRGRVFFGSFPSEVRPEFVNYEIMSFLKNRVDNRRIIMGAQSGSPRILNIIRGKHSVDDVIKAVDATIKAGFRAEVDFIFGFPQETVHDLNLTLKLISRLVKMGAVIRGHTFLPLAGSPMGDENLKPVPAWFKKELARLCGMGKMYGHWEKQEKLSKEITYLRTRGIIKTRELNSLLLSRGKISTEIVANFN
ncbi:MAG: TIGR04013 family B12-binding domain/radical SAM domain-containing protein [Candidatus Baldrarchaeia archaeon]